MLASSRYDLIVSDWGMRLRAGLDFLLAIRADERTRETPVIMVASDAGSGVAERADATESSIVKPFNAATLRTKINHALGAHPK
jgi:two-component system chemotaxis response regulator CheY